jgi:cell division septal protein FtsQ
LPLDANSSQLHNSKSYNSEAPTLEFTLKMREKLIRIVLLLTIIVLLAVIGFFLTVPVWITTRQEQVDAEQLYFKFKADEITKKAREK